MFLIISTILSTFWSTPGESVYSFATWASFLSTSLVSVEDHLYPQLDSQPSSPTQGSLTLTDTHFQLSTWYPSLDIPQAYTSVTSVKLSACQSKWNPRISIMLLLAHIPLPVPFTGLKTMGMCPFPNIWHLVGIYSYSWGGLVQVTLVCI